jgi:hypothetical protein
MLQDINPLSCSKEDLIYYLLTYNMRYDNISLEILNKQLKYIVQLIITQSRKAPPVDLEQA